MPTPASIPLDRHRRQAHALWHDDRAATTGSALAIVFGLVGMVLIAAGGFTSILPLIMIGAGATVIGFAAFLIAEKVHRDHVRAIEARTRGKARDGAEARNRSATSHDAAVTSGGRPLPPRSPLADAAVEALTREDAGGGIYPPLPSTRSRTSQGPADTRATARRDGVTTWTAGEAISTPGMVADDEIRFESVDAVTAQHAKPPLVVGTAGAPHVTATAGAPMRDHRAWPGTQDAPAWSSFLGEGGSDRPRYDKEETTRRMNERRQRLASQLPLVGAMLDPAAREAADRADPMRGKTRGKCSRCSSIIWAPAERPIVLKCPGCGHKAKLY